MRIVFLGLSITSSWGTGHATNYRALVRALAGRGHEVTFLERDVPWYAANRDLPSPPWCETHLYGSPRGLRRFAGEIARADLAVLGSYVPDGVAVGCWLLQKAGGATAFWDIDTPVTVAKLDRGDHEYLAPSLVPRFDLYLSFTGGPLLSRLEHDYGARTPVAFYCMADTDLYRPLDDEERWLLGYLGTYSADRQEALEELLLRVARRLPGERFAVAGPQYPAGIDWPANVERIEHVAPGDHARFYARQRFTLNVTRDAMRRAGWSPSVRLFEAAACAVPVVSDRWPGLDELFLPGTEIAIADRADDVVAALTSADAAAMGAAARARVLAEHTPEHRAAELESHVRACAGVAA
jgi:spore maturation protein CgeB